MSNGRNDLSGSAAREHERGGGNVEAGKSNLPAAGDAARKAERDGEAVNEAHGVRTTPRGEYRGLSVNLRSPRGAKLVETEPETDWSSRKASDYLPPQLKAELIAAGKLTEDGRMVPEGEQRPVAAPRPATEDTQPAASVAAGKPESRGAWNAITGFFRRLFS